jgi:hypothetical protein
MNRAPRSRRLTIGIGQEQIKIVFEQQILKNLDYLNEKRIRDIRNNDTVNLRFALCQHCGWEQNSVLGSPCECAWQFSGLPKWNH